MLLENAPCVECIDKGLCFLLKHRYIIATAYWILLLKPSFVISQGQPCWHTFHALMSAKNKRPIKCVKPKLTPLYFHSSHAWNTLLLYCKIQQFFWECVIMHECNNYFSFPSQSSIYITAGNLLIHSILLCSLNVEENFLFWLRGVNNTASERYVCTLYAWISFINNYVSLRTCQFHIGKIYLSHRIIF